VTVVIDNELILGLFYLVSKIIFVFLLTRDCRFVYCLFEFNDCFIYNTKFHFDPQCCKSKNIINSDRGPTLTLPPT